MTAISADRDHGLRVAGGLVVRRGADGQRRGETLLTTALREVREETGFLGVADAVIGVTEYLDRRGRPKLVRYWAMNAVTGSFVAGTEVDAIAWVRPAEALVRLSHDHDRDLLEGAGGQLDDILARRERLRAQSLG